MIVFGLGNPGPKYSRSRHNAGFMTVEKLAAREDLSLRKRCLLSYKAARKGSLTLVEPLTYMNSSGRIFPRLVKGEDTVVVIVDNMDLPLGRIRIRQGGGDAGHNGLKSITACLAGAQNYYRLRIGIGHPDRSDVINWVLNRPAPQDRDKIDAALDAALLGIGTLFKDGVNKATSFINGFKPL